MDAILHEWGSLLLRWVHIVAGIAWIGSSFYFMHLDASLRPSSGVPAGKGGEAWEVHGGGFYQVKKYLVAPDRLPDELMWHKWESYATWISGFFLLAWIYYLGSDLYLIDAAVMALKPWAAAGIGVTGLALGWIVYDLLCRSALGKNDAALAAAGFVFVVAMAYFFQTVFSGRGAHVHTGALMATMMTGNVFFVIIPNQKKVIADLVAGRSPDPALGKAGKQRSSHNNYLTLPVLFLMLSSHYPLTYSSPYSWALVGLVLVAGAVVRHFYNERHAGRGDKWWTWAAAAACIVLAMLIGAATTPAGREALGLRPQERPAVALGPGAPQAIADIVTSRCAMCHAAEPVWEGIAVAPKGVDLATAEQIARQAEAIRVHAVMTRAMPPNNITEMTDDERRRLAAWLATRRAP